MNKSKLPLRETMPVMRLGYRVHGDGGDGVVVGGVVLNEQVRPNIPHLQGLVRAA